MKRNLLFLVMLAINCGAMEYLSEYELKAKYHQEINKLSEYQKNRNKMLLESYAVWGFSHLNELTEAQKDQRFNDKFDLRSFIADESAECLKLSFASPFAWLSTIFFTTVAGLEYFDTWGNGQCTSEPQRTVAIAVCSVCGIGMCCAACISTVLCCDACKKLHYGEKVQKEYEAIMQLKKMGAKKSE